MHIDKFLNVKSLETLKEQVLSKKGDVVREANISFNELNFIVSSTDFLDFVLFLRDDRDCLFRQLIDITAVDYLGREPRFDVVYHFLSLKKNLRIRVKVPVEDGDSIPTLTEVFGAANWYERETYDMFGILFENHPDLRRILTDYDFEGFPLRKDFPTYGKVEMFYSDELKRCVYRPVELTKEFREFDKTSPWRALDENRHLAEEDSVFDIEEFEKEGEQTNG